MNAVRRRRILLERPDFDGIAKLMGSGFTLQEALSLLETPACSYAFDHIRNLLTEGMQPADFFPDISPKEYRPYLSGFLQCLPFSDALQLCMDVVSGEEAQRKEYVHGLFYPCMMFLCTIGGVTLFNEFCFPPLLSLMEGFHVASSDYTLLRIILRLIGAVVAIVLLLAGIVITWFVRRKSRINAYLFFAKHFPNAICIQYETTDFIRFYLQCVKMNMATKESLNILCSLQNRPVIQFLAEVMTRSLKTGEPFRQAVELPWLDPALNRFMKIAYYSSDMENMLSGYLQMAKERSHRQCVRITRIVQILSYAAIGTIVILIYQIMLLPMKLLAGI